MDCPLPRHVLSIATRGLAVDWPCAIHGQAMNCPWAAHGLSSSRSKGARRCFRSRQPSSAT
eukprot:7074894-Lingulodinium_polyedra.AAC.1